MSRFAVFSVLRPGQWVRNIVFVVSVIVLFALARCTAQVPREGISVELPVTSSAAPMPDADTEEAVIVAVTANGSAYLGTDSVIPDTLTDRIKGVLSRRTDKKLYVKADARTSYGNIMKVLSAAHAAGVEAPILLTAQREPTHAGTPVPPAGLGVLIGPAASAGAGSIVIQVISSGEGSPTLKINGEQMPGTSLQAKLSELLQKRTDKVVVLKADELMPFGNVAHVIDICRSAGAKTTLAPVR